MAFELSMGLKQRFQVGVTLIELILSMVIISIALTGILSVMNLTVSHSADPIVQHQAIAVAEGYLEEILLQSAIDPDGTNTGETRPTYDNVADYNGLNDIGAHTQQGALIASLSSYNVSVVVVNQIVTGVAAQEVTVTVSGRGVTGLALVGYKFAF
jgi:MSHA pilin protein MshD